MWIGNELIRQVDDGGAKLELVAIEHSGRLRPAVGSRPSPWGSTGGLAVSGALHVSKPICMVCKSYFNVYSHFLNRIAQAQEQLI